MRIEGAIRGSQYVITGPSGVMKEIPLDQARQDKKLAASIKRNGWQEIPDGGQ